jgi:hypothetical protein
MDGLTYPENQPLGLFTPSPYVDTTWILLIDMATKPQEWKKMDIDPEFVKRNEKYGKLFNFVLEHIESMKDKPLVEQVALLKTKFLKIPIPDHKEMAFVKTKDEDNYVQIMVDGKPLGLSKKIYITLHKFFDHSLFTHALLEGRTTLSDVLLRRLGDPEIAVLILYKELTLTKLESLHDDLVAELKNKNLFELLRLECFTLKEYFELSDESRQLIRNGGHLGMLLKSRYIDRSELSLIGLKENNIMSSFLSKNYCRELVYDRLVRITAILSLPEAVRVDLDSKTIYELFKRKYLTLDVFAQCSDDERRFLKEFDLKKLSAQSPKQPLSIQDIRHLMTPAPLSHSVFQDKDGTAPTADTANKISGVVAPTSPERKS